MHAPPLKPVAYVCLTYLKPVAHVCLTYPVSFPSVRFAPFCSVLLCAASVLPLLLRSLRLETMLCWDALMLVGMVVVDSEPVGSTAHLRWLQRCRAGLFRYLLCAAAGSAGQATQVCDSVRMPCGGALDASSCPCVVVPVPRARARAEP